MQLSCVKASNTSLLTLLRIMKAVVSLVIVIIQRRQNCDLCLSRSIFFSSFFYFVTSEISESFIIYCLRSSWWVLTSLGNTQHPGNICVGAQVSSDLISKASEFLYRSVFSGVLFISATAGWSLSSRDRLQGQLGIDTDIRPGAERVTAGN